MATRTRQVQSVQSMSSEDLTNRDRAREPIAGPSSPSRREILPHLEGLRGVAVLAVLLFHLGLSGVQGGFTGVDVFFVLSGFLITGLLLRERERTGRIDLAAFYARRARRILPAAILVIVVTVGVAAVVLAPLDVPRVTLDGAASALSIGNVRFAIESTDYFAEPTPSPFRHYWSLGVEEQFYLFWPALIILALRARRDRPLPPRQWVGVVVGLVVIGSLAGSIALTAVNGPWAFYSFPTRAWQLGLGGLLAVAAGWIERRSGRLLAALAALGLAGVVGSFVVLAGSMPYPGVAALLPSFATAAVIAGGARPGPAASLLGLAPVRWLGRISYSLYLWHWPILVLPVLALGRPLAPEESVVLGAGSIALAALSWRFVEEPFRRGWSPARPRRRTLLSAVGAMLVTAMASVIVGNTVLWQLEVAASESPAATSPASTVPASTFDTAPADSTLGAPGDGSSPPIATSQATPSAGAGAGATPTPEPTADAPLLVTPLPEPATSAGPAGTPVSPTPVPTSAAGPIPLPPGIRPSLTRARDDADPLVRDRCGLNLSGSNPPACVYGRKDGAVSVALVGDSHAEQWFPALERLAEERGWRLLPFTKYSCPFVDLPIFSPYLGREYTECEAWRPRVVAALQAARPDLVIVASHRWFPTMVAGDTDRTRQGEAMARLVGQIPGQLVLLADTPVSKVDVPACLSRHLRDITACETDRQTAFGWSPGARERLAARLTGATLVDLSDVLCPGSSCPVVIDRMIVYRDDHHLTATFAAALANVLGARLPPIAPTGAAGAGS